MKTTCRLGFFLVSTFNRHTVKGATFWIKIWNFPCTDAKPKYPRLCDTSHDHSWAVKGAKKISCHSLRTKGCCIPFFDTIFKSALVQKYVGGKRRETPPPRRGREVSDCDIYICIVAADGYKPPGGITWTYRFVHSQYVCGQISGERIYITMTVGTGHVFCSLKRWKFRPKVSLIAYQRTN